MHSTNFTKGNDTTKRNMPEPYQRLYIKKMPDGSYQVRMWSPGSRRSNTAREIRILATFPTYPLALAEKDRRHHELFQEYMRGL